MGDGDVDFDGLRVAALESRRAAEMARLIEKHGGRAYVSPSMREVPIEPNREAIEWAYRVITGEIGVLVVMTGGGWRFLLRAIERHVGAQKFLDAVSDIITVARGPKPVAAMREVGLKPTHRVPEPNTWRELLQTLDQQVPLMNQTVGVIEYGIPNTSLVAGLEARGAAVVPVRVYGWEFPEDRSALQQNVRALAAGERDLLLLTSSHQVVNLLRMADEMQLTERLRQSLERTVIASIGPTTTETLQECELRADLEPPHPKMGHLVTESARRARELLKNLSRGQTSGGAGVGPASSAPPAVNPSVGSKSVGAPPQGRGEERAAGPGPGLAHLTSAHPAHESLFLRACRAEPTERTPIWLMRQAGRYMSEYRAVRQGISFLELCRNPALCSEVMCTAVHRLGVDAAIIFSDLLPILEPMGFELEFLKGDGPVIHNPVRAAEDLDRVRELEDPSALDYVYETVRQTRADLPESLPLIGFAGSPFTLASYAIEGGGSRQYIHTKRLMYGDRGAWDALMGRLSRAVVGYLNEQIAAGAQCVQLFDSWAGCLGPEDYRQYVLPSMQEILAGITPGVPVINFATGNPELLRLLRGDERTVVGVDWRIGLDAAWQRVGYDRPVQGNLDPAVLLADRTLIRKGVQRVLDHAAGRPGHIFNLGHGVLQPTPVEHAIELVELVKELSGGRKP